MDKETRIKSFAKLGAVLRSFVTEPEKMNSDQRGILDQAHRQATAHNAWFTAENIEFAFREWSELLRVEKLETWLNNYAVDDKNPQNIAVIMAGNVPLVGFHDFLSVLLSGHRLIARLSSKDKVLLPALVKILEQDREEWGERIHFESERMTNFDAVIATGSNNTARYFEYYFGDKPNIIRKNRNGVAVLTGRESEEELKPLGEDIFRYFGLGCRNVSKLFVPEGFDFDPLFKAIYPWRDIINHHKYGSNYDYNKAVYLMSDYKILENGFFLLNEMPGQLASPLAVLFYEYYESESALNDYLEQEQENIQCVVSSDQKIQGSLPFGESQHPQLTDYADGVDTMAFLSKL